MSARVQGSAFVLEPGFHLDGYELLCVLARGGMGVVWLARMKGPKGIDKLVAVKTVQPAQAQDEKFQRMLIAEAAIASAITDPHVVKVLDVGQQGEVAFLVMDLVDGESLRALHDGLAKREMKMPLGIALRLTADVCSGLAAAHGLKAPDGRTLLGVVHRDLSPENVLVASDGRAQLIDFGIATAKHRMPADARVGGMAGKPQFLAPEVALGLEVDARADLWSAGALLYFMLAGQPPYGTGPALATMHALAARAPLPPLPSSVPGAARAVVELALQHHREKRFTHALAMRNALDEAAAVSGGMATRREVAEFLALALKDRIAGRLKAIERGLTEAVRRAQVYAALMAPPEILPAGEQTTPLRASEARQAAAESAAMPSSQPTRQWIPEHVDTLRPPATQPFPMMPATTTGADASPAAVPGTVGSSPPRAAETRGSSRPEAAFGPEPGTHPYALRPPSRPPRPASGSIPVATPPPAATSNRPRKPSSIPPPLPPPTRTWRPPAVAPDKAVEDTGDATVIMKAPFGAEATETPQTPPTPLTPPPPPHLLLAESDVPPALMTSLAAPAVPAPPPTPSQPRAPLRALRPMPPVESGSSSSRVALPIALGFVALAGIGGVIAGVRSMRTPPPPPVVAMPALEPAPIPAPIPPPDPGSESPSAAGAPLAAAATPSTPPDPASSTTPAPPAVPAGSARALVSRPEPSGGTAARASRTPSGASTAPLTEAVTPPPPGPPPTKNEDYGF